MCQSRTSKLNYQGEYSREPAISKKWHESGLTVAVTLVGAVGFLVWDAVAISRGFFGRGESPAMLGIEVAPHLPIEELVFVTFLSYLTLVVFGGALRLLRPGPRTTPEVRS